MYKFLETRQKVTKLFDGSFWRRDASKVDLDFRKNSRNPFICDYPRPSSLSTSFTNQFWSFNLSINTQFGTTFDLIRFVPPHMGLPGFLGSSIGPIKAKSAKKKRGLVRENRRFDPLGPRSNSGVRTKNFRVGRGCPISSLLTMKELADFDNVRLKSCQKCQGRLHQMMEFREQR